MGKRHKMSLDSKLRRARMNGTRTTLRHYEVATVCEALRLLRACERAENADRAAAANQPADKPTEGLDRFLANARRETQGDAGAETE